MIWCDMIIIAYDMIWYATIWYDMICSSYIHSYTIFFFFFSLKFVLDLFFLFIFYSPPPPSLLPLPTLPPRVCCAWSGFLAQYKWTVIIIIIIIIIIITIIINIIIIIMYWCCADLYQLSWTVPLTRPTDFDSWQLLLWRNSAHCLWWRCSGWV